MAFTTGLGSWSLPLGSCLFGIPVRLHLTFLVLLVIQTLAAIPGGKWWALMWFIVLGPVLLVTVLVHELGHCLAARSVGGTAESVLLWPLGGLAFISHSASPKKDIWVAAAGPLTHVPMVVIWCLGSLAATRAAYGRAFVTVAVPYPDPRHLGVAVCSMGIVMNIVIFVFNLLLPVYPLDGGRILVDSLLACGVAPPTAAKVAIGVALPLATGILIYGAVRVQVTTILIAAFVYWALWQLFQYLRQGRLHEHPLFAYTSAEQAAATAAAQRQGAAEAGVAVGVPAAAAYAAPAYPAAAPAAPALYRPPQM